VTPSRRSGGLSQSHAIVLILGLALGAILAGRPSPRLAAQSSDRAGESAVATGPVAILYQPKLKAQVAQDALYYLDYRAGKLLAAIPESRTVGGAARFLGEFAERDLVADFRPPPGVEPHFVMSVGNLGTADGWAPLYVFETATAQVAVYRAQPRTLNGVSNPKFELLELRTLRGPASP